MSITIRTALPVDFPAILSLVKALAVFQNEEHKVTNTLEDMRRDRGLFHCIVAENEEREIIGIACYFFAYHTWVGKSLYLDDLYVNESFRGNKTGSKLLGRIFEIASDAQCKRVRWQVSNWNKSAIAFYERCGAHIDKEIYNCDFDEAAIENFLSGNSSKAG